MQQPQCMPSIRCVAIEVKHYNHRLDLVDYLLSNQQLKKTCWNGLERLDQTSLSFFRPGQPTALAEEK